MLEDGSLIRDLNTDEAWCDLAPQAVALAAADWQAGRLQTS